MQLYIEINDNIKKTNKCIWLTHFGLKKIQYLIRQADGDNPIVIRGRIIVKQTTENEKKSKLIFLKK